MQDTFLETYGMPLEELEKRIMIANAPYEAERLAEKQLCEKYHITPYEYRRRLSLGWSQTVALETPPQKRWFYKQQLSDNLYVDTYVFDKDKGLMYWCVHNHHRKRLTHAMIHQILDEECARKDIDIPENDMEKCKRYNIHPNVYRRRKAQGWSESAALNTPYDRDRFPIGTKFKNLVITNHIFTKEDGLFYACVDDCGMEDLYVHAELTQLIERS